MKLEYFSPVKKEKAAPGVFFTENCLLDGWSGSPDAIYDTTKRPMALIGLS